MNIIICGRNGDRSCGFDLITNLQHNILLSLSLQLLDLRASPFSLFVSVIFEKQQHNTELVLYKN